MGPPKAKTAAPSGRALMTAQQKKDADIANVGAKAALKAAAAAEVAANPTTAKKIDRDQVKAAGQGGVSKADKKKGGKQDLSFLDASIKK